MYVYIYIIYTYLSVFIASAGSCNHTRTQFCATPVLQFPGRASDGSFLEVLSELGCTPVQLPISR